MTSFWRGYCATVPPSESCSMTSNDRPAARAPTAVAIPAGPAPTITRSGIPLATRPGQRLAQPGRHLQPLGQRVLDQPHPPELPDDVDPWSAGFEERVHLGQLHAAFGRPEHQPDRAHRTFGGAPAMADAVRSADQRRHTVDQPQDLPLRAGAQSTTRCRCRCPDRSPDAGRPGW